MISDDSVNEMVNTVLDEEDKGSLPTKRISIRRVWLDVDGRRAGSRQPSVTSSMRELASYRQTNLR